jgi:hypothetical protein
MSDSKLQAVRACIGGALRKQVNRYASGLDDAVLQKVLDSAKLGRPANIQLAVTVGVSDLLARANSGPPAVPTKATASPFACDVYLAGSPGGWRDKASKYLDGHVVYDPEKDQLPGGKGRAIHVPRGVNSRVVLFAMEDGAPDVAAGLLAAVWHYGMSAVIVLGDCPQRETLLEACRLSGSHVFQELEDAVEEVSRILGEGPEAPDAGLDEAPSSENETTVMLPSGNCIVVKYFGYDNLADRIMLHSRSVGSAGAPMNMDLIVPDPDNETDDWVQGQDGQQVHPVNVHRIQVRHHGPTDTGRGILPPGFLPPGSDPRHQQ